MTGLVRVDAVAPTRQNHKNLTPPQRQVVDLTGSWPRANLFDPTFMLSGGLPSIDDPPGAIRLTTGTAVDLLGAPLNHDPLLEFAAGARAPRSSCRWGGGSEP